MSVNKKNINRIISLFCVFQLLISCFIVSIPASAQNGISGYVEAENSTAVTGGVLTVLQTTASPGGKVSVSVVVKDNPGIWGLKFKVGYDHSVLTLASVENGDIFANEEVTLPDSLDKEEYVYLAYLNGLKNKTEDGTIVKLNFTVSQNAELKPYIVNLTIEQAINVNGEDVGLRAQAAAVTLVKCVHEINIKWESNEEFHWHNCVAKDCNERIEDTVSKHQFVDVPEVEATCTNDGLTGGRKCSVCGYIVKKQETVPASGHSLKVIPAVKATTERTGLTQGKKCKICGAIIVPGKKVAKLPYKMKKSAKASCKLKMYEKKKTSSKVIKTVKEGAKVTIVDINKKWYKIKYKDKVGFVKSKFVVWKGKVKTKDGKLRLRAGAGTNYEVIDSFPSGTSVTVLESASKSWYKVSVNKGRYTTDGYMFSKYIK